MTFLHGLSAFPITPADRDGRVDTAALRRLVARLCAARVESIGLLGSTGTYMYLSREDRRRALSAALEEAAGRVPVVAGIGALRTDEAVALARDAKALGAAAGLLAAVSYTPLTEDEVYEHVSTVARESGLPVVIYDNPGTTHFRFSQALVARLAQVPGIVAIKNPTGAAEEIAGHLAGQRLALPKGFAIGYSGDWNAAAAMIAGADTWYSVIGGILPGACKAIVAAAQAGDATEARRIDAELAPVWDLFKAHSSLRTVYFIADLLGLCRAEPPRPILPLAESARHRIVEVFSQLPSELAQ